MWLLGLTKLDIVIFFSPKCKQMLNGFKTRQNLNYIRKINVLMSDGSAGIVFAIYCVSLITYQFFILFSKQCKHGRAFLLTKTSPSPVCVEYCMFTVKYTATVLHGGSRFCWRTATKSHLSLTLHSLVLSSVSSLPDMLLQNLIGNRHLEGHQGIMVEP